MSKYEFSLVLKGSVELIEDIADMLFEHGCDDGTPGVCDGVFTIDFHREAESLEAAILPFCVFSRFLWQSPGGVWLAKQVGHRKRNKTQKRSEVMSCCRAPRRHMATNLR